MYTDLNFPFWKILKYLLLKHAFIIQLIFLNNLLRSCRCRCVHLCTDVLFMNGVLDSSVVNTHLSHSFCYEIPGSFHNSIYATLLCLPLSMLYSFPLPLIKLLIIHLFFPAHYKQLHRCLLCQVEHRPKHHWSEDKKLVAQHCGSGGGGQCAVKLV